MTGFRIAYSGGVAPAVGQSISTKHDRMPNPWYLRGRSFEYSCMNRLRAGGYDVWRAAGSKGAADLVAIGADILLIQCKCAGALTFDEWNKLYDLAARARGVPLLALKAKGHGADYIRLKERRTAKHVRLNALMERYDPFGQGTLF